MKKNPPRSSSKRPTATIDLKAQEIKKDTLEKASDKSASSTSGSTRSTDKTTSSKRTTSAVKLTAAKSTSTGPGKGPHDAKKINPPKADGPKTSAGGGASKPPQTPTPSKQGGGFISHVLASVIGAVLGIFGLSFTNNQNLLPSGLQLSGGQAVKEQIVALSGKIGQLEKQTTSSDTNSLGGRLTSLAARIKKTETNLGGNAGVNTLVEKVSRLETTIGNLEQAAKTGEGGQLAGLTAVTKQLSKSNEQSLTLKTELIKLREEQTSFREDLANVRSAQADFQSSSAKISDELAKVQNNIAKMIADASHPPDVSAQIRPLTTMLGTLTTKVDGVLNREASSKAEGRDIALALSLGELKRAVNQGSSFVEELARVQPHAPQSLDLSILTQHADTGLVTREKLRSSFSSFSHKALASQSTATSGSIMDQIMANAKSMVQVRPTGLIKGDTTGAILSRMEYKLDRNDLAGGLKEGEDLRGQAKDIMQAWLDRAGSRLGGDTVLRTLEDKIRNALAGSVSK